MSPIQRTLLLLVIAVLATAALAAETLPSVAVTIRMVETNDGATTASENYRLVARADGQTVSIMTGTRIPIAVTKFQTPTPPSGEIVPLTSYTYQNVGFMADVEVRVVDGKVDVVASIENSRVEEGSDDGHPVIATSHQRVRAMLEEGEPLEIIRFEDSDGRTVRYEIEADVL